MQNLPYPKANERRESEPSKILYSFVGRYCFRTLAHGGEIESFVCTVRACETLFAFLEVSHLIHNFFHQTLQPSHLCFKARQRFLVRNGTVNYVSQI